MSYYEVIGGSRCYGLELPTSDIDLCRVADTFDIGGKEGEYNLIQIPLSEFAERVAGDRYNAFYLQWLFPYAVRSDNNLTQYLQANRERITYAQRQRVGRVLLEHAGGLEQYAERLYESFPKRLAYATLFYAIYANYAEGMPFAQAHHAGALQQKLLQIRRHEIPLEDVLSLLDAQKSRAVKAAGFYAAPEDTDVIVQVRQVILSAANTL